MNYTTSETDTPSESEPTSAPGHRSSPKWVSITLAIALLLALCGVASLSSQNQNLQADLESAQSDLDDALAGQSDDQDTIDSCTEDIDTMTTAYSSMTDAADTFQEALKSLTEGDYDGALSLVSDGQGSYSNAEVTSQETEDTCSNE